MYLSRVRGGGRTKYSIYFGAKFQDLAGIAGAVLIATGLVGGGLAGVYVDKTKKFQETAKISYGLAAISCCLLAIVSRTV